LSDLILKTDRPSEAADQLTVNKQTAKAQQAVPAVPALHRCAHGVLHGRQAATLQPSDCACCCCWAVCLLAVTTETQPGACSTKTTSATGAG